MATRLAFTLMLNSRLNRHAVAIGGIAILVTGGCTPTDSASADSQAPKSGDTRGQAETRPDTAGRPTSSDIAIPLSVPGLTESSGAAMSVTQSGIWFTINDSGHEPILFAVDTLGAERGRWLVNDAKNNDWEAVAIGSCGDSGSAGRDGAGPMRCVYIGDVGDNDANRRTVSIYRVREPEIADSAKTGSLNAERLRFRYDDGPRDVESMYVGANGTIYLITKRASSNWAGKLQPARTYVLPASAWPRSGSGANDTVTATFDQLLPIVPGSAPLRTITDAAAAPDGRHVAVRTYGEVYLFKSTEATGRILSTVRPSVCTLVPLDEWQGEGITWHRSSLLLTSERAKSPMHIIGCPLP
jgi:hypothetical protein